MLPPLPKGGLTSQPHRYRGLPTLGVPDCVFSLLLPRGKPRLHLQPHWLPSCLGMSCSRDSRLPSHLLPLDFSTSLSSSPARPEPPPLHLAHPSPRAVTDDLEAPVLSAELGAVSLYLPPPHPGLQAPLRQGCLGTWLTHPCLSSELLAHGRRGSGRQ